MTVNYRFVPRDLSRTSAPEQYEPLRHSPISCPVIGNHWGCYDMRGHHQRVAADPLSRKWPVFLESGDSTWRQLHMYPHLSPDEKMNHLRRKRSPCQRRFLDQVRMSSWCPKPLICMVGFRSSQPSYIVLHRLDVYSIGRKTDPPPWQPSPTFNVLTNGTLSRGLCV